MTPEKMTKLKKLGAAAGSVYKAFYPSMWTPNPFVGTLKDAISKRSGVPSDESIARLEQAIKEYKGDQ